MRRLAGAWLVGVGCVMPNPAFQAVSAGEGSASGETSATTTSAATTSAATTSAATTTGPETTGPGTSITSSATETTSETGETSGTGTTGAPAECGDSDIDPGEVCDGGPEPPLEPGACRPDCAGEIETRTIFVTAEPITGNFALDDDISAADAFCADAADALGLSGVYMALISDATRWGAIMAHDGQCSADWPLQRFTAYANLQGDIVWVTGEVRLLGVVAAVARGEPNTPAPLLAAIDAGPLQIWTGLASTWQTAATCNNWQPGAQEVGTVGDASLVEGFLDTGEDQLCAADYNLVCVQQ